MKKVLGLIVALVCAVSLQAKGDLHLFEIANKDGAITPLEVEKALTSNGFTLGVNSEMNYPFTKQFKDTDFKIFTLLTVHHSTYAHELVNKYPQAGVFIPMGVGIYQKLNENTLHLSVLTADAQAKILGIEDELLSKIEADVIAAITKRFPNAKHSYSEDSLKEARSLVTQYELKLNGADADDAKDEFEMMLESGFEPHGFVMPAYLDLNEEINEKEDIESVYDFYVTYSICKLEVIYTVAKSRPEAAAFAPCTTMVYKKSDEDKIVVGFPAVYNWMSSAHVQDQDAKEVLLKAQQDFESVLKNVTE
ncbi:MAG: DUF302 domain-containing protein [Helicobacteraceae bacterium]|nr:DUF302 domain-containing protein [Helicobacteraceae bacterium]